MIWQMAMTILPIVLKAMLDAWMSDPVRERRKAAADEAARNRRIEDAYMRDALAFEVAVGAGDLDHIERSLRLLREKGDRSRRE